MHQVIYVKNYSRRKETVCYEMTKVMIHLSKPKSNLSLINGINLEFCFIFQI